MKCEEVQTLIEDYIDSALDQKAMTFVKSHITGCAACSSFYRELTREQEIYARYERDVEVTPALWASIESRIKQERAERPLGLLSRLREQLAGVFAAPRLSPAFAAALVIIAIGITVVVMSYMNSRVAGTGVAKDGGNESVQPVEPEKSQTPPPVNSQAAPSNLAANGGALNDQPETSPAKAAKSSIPQKHISAQAALTPTQLVREAEQKYLAAIAMLSRDVNRQRSGLDPMLVAKLDASLSEIDRTIKETRRVVRENPSDPIALQYLLAAYSKKVEVLRGMTTD